VRWETGTAGVVEELPAGAARSSGKVSAPADIHFKGEINLVTDVDRESEGYILGRIRERFPDHGMLSEESPNVFPIAVRWSGRR